MIPWKITKELVKVLEKNKTETEDANVILAKFNKILENMNVHNRCVQTFVIVGDDRQFPISLQEISVPSDAAPGQGSGKL